MVEGGGLDDRYRGFSSIGGSHPSLSASAAVQAAIPPAQRRLSVSVACTMSKLLKGSAFGDVA